MNFIKRALLSVKARKGRTFITLIIFMIICNLVLAGFAIRSATEKASDLARQKLGSEVTLQVNMDMIIQKEQKVQNGEVELPSLTEQMAEKLTKLDHVKSYNYIFNTVVVADGFKPFSTSNNSQEQDSGNGRVVGSSGPPGFKKPDITVNGILNGELLASFKDGTDKIVEGHQITKGDADKQIVVIEKHLAEKNKLKVGSKVKIKSVDDKTSGEFEVVGIYETSSSSQKPMGMDMPFLDPYNKMYVPYKASLKFNFGNQEPGMNQAVYYLDDPKNIEAFKAAAKKQDIDFESFKLDAKDEAYKKMTGPIENVASFSKTVVYIVAIAGAVILGLIVLLSIKERRYEMGVLLSIGERKGKLVGQFLAEILLIGSLAFVLSMFTGNMLSQKVGDSLLQKEIAVSKQQIEEQPKQGMVQVIGPDGPQENINMDAIDHIDVSATANDIRNLGLVGLIIAIFATIIPSLSILRLHPKTILTKTE